MGNFPIAMMVLTHIILPNMDALGANCKSNIDTVIDEQRNAMGLGKLVDSSSSVDQFGRVSRFVSVLNNGDAWTSWSASLYFMLVCVNVSQVA
jgi:hypothetical protein